MVSQLDLTLPPAYVTLHCSMKNKSSTRRHPGDHGKPKLVIKKYSDRRLYDSGASRYVKLGDVARMVRDGIEVKVVDARSGKDLTYLILTQIILEDARERETPLPLQLLTQLVRASDRATHDFLSWYLNNTLDLYQKAQDAVRARLPEAKAAVARPIDFVRNLLAERPAPPSPTVADITEVEELRRRVEELEVQLARRGKNKSKGS
jgi:polyhydroxyalkanoate synthesis repressor PhaR